MKNYWVNKNRTLKNEIEKHSGYAFLAQANIYTGTLNFQDSTSDQNWNSGRG